MILLVFALVAVILMSGLVAVLLSGLDLRADVPGLSAGVRP